MAENQFEYQPEPKFHKADESFSMVDKAFGLSLWNFPWQSYAQIAKVKQNEHSYNTTMYTSWTHIFGSRKVLKDLFHNLWALGNICPISMKVAGNEMVIKFEKAFILYGRCHRATTHLPIRVMNLAVVLLNRMWRQSFRKFYRAQFPRASIAPKLHIRKNGWSGGALEQDSWENKELSVYMLTWKDWSKSIKVSLMIWTGSSTSWRNTNWSQRLHWTHYDHLLLRRERRLTVTAAVVKNQTDSTWVIAYHNTQNYH